jgi:hypothetical protein
VLKEECFGVGGGNFVVEHEISLKPAGERRARRRTVVVARVGRNRPLGAKAIVQLVAITARVNPPQ